MPSGVDLKKLGSPSAAKDSTFLRLEIVAGELVLVDDLGASTPVGGAGGDVVTQDTVDATPANLFVFTTPDNDKAYLIEGHAQAYNAATGDTNSYKIIGQWRKDGGGTLTEKNFTLVVNDEAGPLAAAGLQGNISGNDIRIQVVGIAATNLAWDGRFTVTHR